MAISDSTGHQYEVNASAKQIAAALLQRLPAATIMRTEHGQAQLDSLEKTRVLLEKIEKTLDKELKDVSDNVADIVKTVEECCGRMFKKAARVDSKAATKGVEAGLTAELLKETKQTNRYLAGLGDKMGGGGGSGAGDIAAPGSGGWKSKLTKAGKNLGSFLVAGLSTELSSAFEHFGLTGKNLFRGALVGSLQFNQKMRQIMYSVEGTGVAMTSLEKQWINIGKTTEQTGMLREHTQEAYMKQLRKGLTIEVKGGVARQRNAKDTLKMVTNSLRTANVIGASAEETADLFGEWNRQIGLTNSQMGTLGRSMEMIARSTGVTGDNLLEAAKGAQQTIMAVRNFGGINERAMAQIIEMQASMKKFGTETIGNEINAALSGGWDTFMAARPELGAMIARASQKSGLGSPGSNILGNAKQTRVMYQALNSEMTSQVQDITGMKGQDLGKILDNMDRLQSGSADDRAQVASMLTQIKATTGLGLGELQQFSKAVDESTKTFEQKMGDIDVKLKGAPVGSDLQKQLMIQKRDLRMTETGGNLSSIARKLEYAEGATPEAKMQDVMKQLDLQGKDVGVMVQSQMSDMANRAKGANKDFNKLLAESGFNQKTLTEALNSGNTDKMQQALEALQEVDNKILVQERAMQDPVTNAQFKLASANDALRSTMEKLLAAVVSLELVIGLAIAAIAAKAIGSTVSTGGGMLRDLWRGGGGGLPIPGGPSGPRGTPSVPTNRRGIPKKDIAGRIGDVNKRRAAKGLPDFAPKGKVPKFKGKGKGLMGALAAGAAIFGVASVASSMTGSGDPDIVGSGGGLEGIPGYGKDCIPVCIVGGKFEGNVSGTGGGSGMAENAMSAAGGGLVGAAMQSYAVADTVSDARVVGGVVKDSLKLSRAAKAVDIAGDASTALRTADVVGDVGKASGIMSKLPGVAGIMSKASPALKALGTVSKAMPFIGPIIGAATGGLESATGVSDRGIVESMVLGGLTGDSTTGSMFSGMLGIEQGSTGDELLGLAGSTLGGAATGAAIGSVVPVVGTAIGAAVGAALGGGAELYKIFTNPDSPIRAWAGEQVTNIGNGMHAVAGMMGIDLTEVSKQTGFTDAAIAAAQIWEGDFSGAASSIGSAITNYSSMMTFGLSDTIAGWAGSLGEMAGGWLSDIGGTMSTWATAAGGVVGGWMSSAQDMFGSAIQGATTLAGGAMAAAGSIASTFIEANKKAATGMMSMLGLDQIDFSKGAEVASGVLSSMLSTGPFGFLLGGGIAGMGMNKVIEAFGGEKEKKLSEGVSAMDTGLFAKDNIYDTDIMAREAMSKAVGVADIGPMLEATKSMQKGSTSASKSMYLSENNDYGEAGLMSSLAASPLGRDPKGFVSTTSMADDDVESYVAQSIEGSRLSGNVSMIPSMDSIFDYLNNDQAGKLDTVIELLSQIRDKTGTSLTMRIPKGSSGNPSTERPGIKTFSKDRATGQWPLQSGGDFQPTHNFTGD